MSAITITDLNNAKTDVDHIAAVANSAALEATDRLGLPKRTLAGVDAEAASRLAVIDASAVALRTTIQASADLVLGNIGYAPPVTYTAGLSMATATKTVEYNGNVYAPLIAQLPFTASGTFETAKFRLVQGVAGVSPDVVRFNGTGTQTVFTLPVAAVMEEQTLVWVGGIYQQKDTYTTFGTVLTFSEAPPLGTDNIEVQVGPSVQLLVPAATEWLTNVTGIGGQGFSYSKRLISNDSLQGTAGGAGKVDGVQIVHTYGGDTAKGGRHGLEVFSILTSPTSPTNPDRNYVGAAFIGEAQTGDGGTVGVPRGAVFGINPVASLRAGATYFANLSAGEFNTATKAGSSVNYKSGIQICGFGDDAIQGTLVDAMISLSGQTGGVKWRDGILISANNGAQPIDPVLGCLFRAEGTATVKTGFSLGSYSFTDFILQAPSFSISPNGSLELGKLGVSNTPYINLHSAATSNAYDVQLIATGGTVGLGTGVLQIAASYVNLVGAGLRISGAQVIGPRNTGWGAATNGSKAAFNGSTATLAQTSAAVAQLIVDLTAHGLIGA
jgi:hypothetical protein